MAAARPPVRHRASAWFALAALATIAFAQDVGHASSLGSHDAATVAAAAVHGEQAPHFEASPLVERLECATCLLQNDRLRLVTPARGERQLPPRHQAGSPAGRAALDGPRAGLPRLRAPPLS